MRFTAAQIAQATDGEVVGDAGAVIDGVAIDSRIVEPGQLFVPIVAERDGHAFIGKAVEAGATVCLSSRDVFGDATTDVPGATVVRVADTALALADLGRAARTRLPDRVVGVTGSVGKTSTKDLLAGVLATTYPTAASEKSFNNELGLPMTLVNAPDGTEAVVLEMGARGVGHIELLCGIGRPTVGVITRVEAVHLEMFGSLEAVSQAKGELIEALPDDGLAVLNADEPVVAAMASRTSAPVLTYGLSPTADVYASNVSLDAQLRASFRLHTP
ncbi:MAG: UDP-N-acetylmuramoyl-tripeptide--D-alanyl-D-alanine ligase, partial [Gordonia amarae]